MSVTARAYQRDRLARIRIGLPTLVAPTPVSVAKPKGVRLERVDAPAARCAYCGAASRRRGVPVVCHAHSDLPGLEIA